MPRTALLAFALLTACGPLAAPIEVASTTDATTTQSPSPTTTQSPDASTTAAPTTTLTSGATTGLDPEPDTTSEQTFIVTPDGFIHGFECDLWSQNCPPGQKCAAWAADGGSSWNSTKCVDVMGDGLPGDPCSTIGGGASGMDDCAFGAMCWDVDENNHGTCRGLCTGTPDAPICPKLHSCAISGDSVLNLCLPGCDPLIQDCPGDNLCIPNGDAFLCVFDASGEGQVNDPCEFANSCDKGLVCLNTLSASAACDQGSQGCCQPFCKFPNTPCPNPDQQCVQWFAPPDVPEGYENVGVCAIPS